MFFSELQHLYHLKSEHAEQYATLIPALLASGSKSGGTLASASSKLLATCGTSKIQKQLTLKETVERKLKISLFNR